MALEGNTLPHPQHFLEPESLWARVDQRTQQALSSGALLSIPTDYEFVEQQGIQFLVRTLSNLIRKDHAKQQQETGRTPQVLNPFLPYEEALFVADLSATHLCLLNKFNVVDRHILIITRQFERQESLLTLEDFTALWICLADYPGLAFYNAGQKAGASQPHKHLQLVPLPLVPQGVEIPIAPLFASARFQGTIATLPDLPFVHAFTSLDTVQETSPQQAAEATLIRYHALLNAVGLKEGDAYNLLATRTWMLLVPRSQESYESISVNSLGFAGSFFVKNQAQMQILKAVSPMTLLTQVGFSLA